MTRTPEITEAMKEAASDMLAALKGAITAIDFLEMPKGAGSEALAAIGKRRSAVMAAIVKAEGRT